MSDKSHLISARPRMPIGERAKQFMPFAALKGLPEALAAKEKIIVPKSEISEERAKELDWKLRMLSRGSVASVVYYSRGEYLKISGMVARIDKTSRILQIVCTKINFDDIWDIKC